ncbi:MAG: metal ABC transporter substrate-binding protein, partial [Firmicutes bacterium]|nr:metal ABC transporter substrate-binding protein [Bacillota bacterium]
EATVYALLNEENGILIEEDHHHEHDGHNHETEEFDEHIWLSPKRAVEFCMEITDLISSIDESNSDVYEENSSAYIEKLKTLDEAYSDALGGKKENTVIFADRFPFRYMAQDYNITWHAAFPGCSAETEASFETITHLSEELKESGLSRLFITETGKSDLADSIIAGSGISNIDVVAVNSMQSIGKDERSTYIEIMEENLEKLQVDFR